MDKSIVLKKIKKLINNKMYSESIIFLEPLLDEYNENYMFKAYYVNSLRKIGRQNEADEYIKNIQNSMPDSYQKNKWLNQFHTKVTSTKNISNFSNVHRNFIDRLKRYIVSKEKKGLSATNEVSLLKKHYEYLKMEDKEFSNNIHTSITNGIFFFQEKKQTQTKTLIISGNARSGTTALGNAFGISEEVAMYTERFNPHFGYHPNMFQERYLYCEGYNKMPHFEQYDEIRKKLNTAKYVGDKRPSFFLSWDITYLNYNPNDLEIIHIIRDIYSVAYSYDERAKNAEKGIDKSWSSDRGVEVACIESNLQNKMLLKALNDKKFNTNIYLVSYDTIFSSLDKLKKLYILLDIKLTTSCEKKLISIVNKGKKLKKKNRKLSDEQLAIIDVTFDFEMYNKILELEKDFWLNV